MTTASAGIVIWMTGLPGAGKTTLSHLLAANFRALGWPVEVLDGDELRTRYASYLGFSRADRDEHVRRVAAMARVLQIQGIVVIVALISPYRATRAEVRASIDAFVEVYVHCPLSECMRRDPKHLYAQARAGVVSELTGYSAPYEAPEATDVIVHTGEQRPDECVARIIRSRSIAALIARRSVGAL